VAGARSLLCLARGARIWSADHGDALGDFVERFHVERETKRAYYSYVRSKTDGFGRRAILCRVRQRSP
jgi:hypothetical protein